MTEASPSPLLPGTESPPLQPPNRNCDALLLQQTWTSLDTSDVFRSAKLPCDCLADCPRRSCLGDISQLKDNQHKGGGERFDICQSKDQKPTHLPSSLVYLKEN